MNALGLEEKMTRRDFLKGIRARDDLIPIINKEKCTGCGLCAMDCQKEALAISQNTGDETYQLIFRQDLCDACRICEKSCPENCLNLEPIPQSNRRGNRAIVIFEDGISRCHECGIPLFPQAMVNHLKSKIVGQGEALFPLDLCPSCRIKIEVGKDWITKK